MRSVDPRVRWARRGKGEGWDLWLCRRRRYARALAETKRGALGVIYSEVFRFGWLVGARLVPYDADPSLSWDPGRRGGTP